MSGEYFCSVTKQELELNQSHWSDKTGEVVCNCCDKPISSKTYPMKKCLFIKIPCENQEAVDRVMNFISEGTMNIDDVKIGDTTFTTKSGNYGEGL